MFKIFSRKAAEWRDNYEPIRPRELHPSRPLQRLVRSYANQGGRVLYVESSDRWKELS